MFVRESYVKLIQEIIELDMQIEDEIMKGIIPDPSTIDPVTGQPLPQMQVKVWKDGSHGNGRSSMKNQDLEGEAASS